MTDTAGALRNTDFEAAIAQNRRRTAILFGVLLLLSTVIGYIVGWAIAVIDMVWSVPADGASRLTIGGVLLSLFGPPRPQAVAGAVIMLGAGLVWGLITLRAGSRILNAFVGARDANPDNPAERKLIDVVQEMAIAAGVPAPRAMVVDSPALNAFATGSSPERAAVTATSGLLEACTREELQGVIGHEIGHVADFDVRYTTMVAAMAGVIVLLAHVLQDIARWSLNWGPGPSRSRGRDSDQAAGIRIAITAVVLVVLVILMIAAPLAARLVQMAISRQREYLADANSVKLTRNPVGLIHALERLDHADTNIARSDSPVSALCIAEPLNARLSGMLSTHPPIPERIARLQNLGGIAAPAASEAHFLPQQQPPTASA